MLKVVKLLEMIMMKRFLEHQIIELDWFPKGDLLSKNHSCMAALCDYSQQFINYKK